MPERNGRLSRITIIILALASLFPLATAFHYTPFLNDDAYITLTYVKNLAGGHGFIFNYPPATLGTTTPLYTLAMTCLTILFSPANIQTIAIFFSACCWLGIVWVIFFFRKAWNLEDWQSGIIGLVIIGSGSIRFLGMESYLFAFLLALCLSLFFSKRYLSAGFFSGLLFLTRGEGVLILAVVSMAVLSKDWGSRILISRESTKTILKLISGFMIPLTAWLIYAYITFGTILPNTLAAKQAQGHSSLWPPFSQSLVQDWIPGWGRTFAIANSPIVNIWWLLILIGMISSLRRNRRFLAFAGWLCLYIPGYILLTVPAYPWYQLPVLFVLNLFFGLGIIAVIMKLLVFMKSTRLSFGLSILLIAVLLFLLARPTVKDTLTFKGEERGESYMAMSRWFNENTKETSSVAFIEIGYLGFYTENRIVDLAGLILPDITPHIAGKDFAWGFWQYRPDYYVSLSDFDWALAAIRTDPRFDKLYYPVEILSGPWNANIVIYKRADYKNIQ